MLNIPLVGVWIKLLSIPYRFLFPAVVCLTCVGVYSLKLSSFDVFMVLGICGLGYAMRLLQVDAAPLLMGLILGPMMEEYFRRAVLLSMGDLTVFLTEPISGGVSLTTVLLLVWSMTKGKKLARELEQGEAKGARRRWTASRAGARVQTARRQAAPPDP